MGRGDGDGGNGKGEMRRGKRKGEMGKLAKGRGRTRGKRRGDFTDGYEMLGWTYGMPVWNEVTELFDFDFVYPCICSPIDGQTARPNGLKFGR